jgi:AraC family transcriptional regulator, ethanolamine operon transcriptional activator
MIDTLHSMHFSLGSVEEMSTVLAGSAWSLDFRQLEKGCSTVEISAITTEAALLMKTELGCKTHQVGALEPGTMSFGLPARVQAPIRFGSRETGSNALTRFDSLSDFEAVSGSEFSAYTVTFRALDMERHMENLGIDTAMLSRDTGCQHRLLAEDSAAQLRIMMEGLLSHSEQPDSRVQLSLVKAIESELAVEILSAFFRANQPPEVSMKNRTRIVKRAIELVDGEAAEGLTIERLCNECACSISTLERGFYDYFGISPKQYLMATRLSGARKALLNTGKERSIGDIAAHWGFWHMSKFSADYKRMFGELPSRTVRAA